LNGKAFLPFTNTTIYLDFNVCINQNFTIKFDHGVLIDLTEKCGFVEPKPKSKTKPSRISKKIVMIVMLNFCAVLLCILVGLILLRKFDDKRSSSPPPPTRKVTTMADLTISEVIIREIKPRPVDDVDSVSSIELIAQELIQSRATENKPSSDDDSNHQIV
jgi:hypothetical protein